MQHSQHGKTIVIKLGTSTLTCNSPRLNKAHMLEIVRTVAKLKERGHRVAVVSSGAMAAGRELLGDPQLPPVLSSKQMLASVGQGKLIEIWESLFSIYGLHIGQILLTRADLESRERFINARDTFFALLEHDIIPVINENDAVSTQEIRVGDNDNMAALTAILSDADLVILLTDQAGLFTADPRTHKDATLIRTVEHIDDHIMAIAGGAGTAQGTGGMSTKIKAARTATAAGIELVIASGADPQIMLELAEGKGTGTFFKPRTKVQLARKVWLEAATRISGCISVDAGAVRALCLNGSSLLPRGVTAVEGEFPRGAVVQIAGSDHKVIARGIVRYSTEELEIIRGHLSEETEKLLGYSRGDVVVHRDDLVLED